MADLPKQTPSRPRTARAGGFFIFAGMLIGGVTGALLRQPSLGMVIGLGIGITIAVAVWLVETKRNRV